MTSTTVMKTRSDDTLTGQRGLGYIAARTLTPESVTVGVLVMLGFTFVQRFVGFGRSVLFCRWLDPAELGQWNIAHGFLMLAVPVVVLGLPAVFGRYVEHYRQRGQLRGFLCRIGCLVCVSFVICASLMIAHRVWVSQMIFGSSEQAGLIILLALALLALVGCDFAMGLFTALRLQRISSALALLNVLCFAAIGIGALLFWQRSARSAVVAFAAAGLLTLVVSCLLLRRSWREFHVGQEAFSHGTFWTKVLRLAVWLWLASAVCNLFGVVDRYMIVHYAGLEAASALSVIGQYHAALLLPYPLVQLVPLVMTVLTPHLSTEWETGRRSRVSARLNLLIKLVGVGLFGSVTLLLLVAPLFFDVACYGKFSAGQSILPWMLICAVWAGIIHVACVYLICCEKAGLFSFAISVGLSANVVLNYVLLPRYGLLGAAVSTTIAQLVVLVVLLLCNSLQGMRLDWRIGWVAALPLVLWTPVLTATLMLIVVLGMSLQSNLLFTPAERHELLGLVRRHVKWRVAWGERGLFLHNIAN